MTITPLAALLITCLLAAAVAPGSTPTPPPRETDTSWLDRFAPPPGYEYAMTPEATKALRDYAASDAFGHPQMRGALEALLDPVRPFANYAARTSLIHAGSRAVPVLLESLRDRRYAPTPEPSHSDRPHPWDFACDRLANLGASELVPILLEAESEGRIPPLRQRDRALWIAAVGGPESIEPTLIAFRDPEPYVQAYASSGVGWALGNGRLSPEMRAAVFQPLLERSLAPPSPLLNIHEIRKLIRVDRRRAIAALTTDEVLSLANPRLADILWAMTYPPAPHVLAPGEEYRPVALPADKLWALWRQSEAEGLAGRHAAPAGALLCALALSDPGRAKVVAEALLDRPGELGFAPISALEIIENFPSGADAVELWKSASPERPAPLPILYVDAVEQCAGGQVLGGISFFLERYNDWRLAPEGFRAMGMNDCAEAVEVVAAVYFGSAGPPADMEERERRIYAHEETPAEERRIRRAEETLEAARDAMVRRIFEFKRKHRELFSTLKPRPDPERP